MEDELTRGCRQASSDDSYHLEKGSVQSSSRANGHLRGSAAQSATAYRGGSGGSKRGTGSVSSTGVPKLTGQERAMAVKDKDAAGGGDMRSGIRGGSVGGSMSVKSGDGGRRAAPHHQQAGPKVRPLVSMPWDASRSLIHLASAYNKSVNLCRLVDHSHANPKRV